MAFEATAATELRHSGMAGTARSVANFRGPGTGGSGGLKSEAPTPAAGGHPQPSGSPPVDKGSGGLKSEAPTHAAADQLEPSGSPPVDWTLPQWRTFPAVAFRSGTAGR
jgi:hypothetical protein